MRKITEIIVHCSATKEGRNFSASDIDRWHREKGWNGIGYHYVVCLDGQVQEGRPLEIAGAHCVGHNSNSIGICYIGGIGDDLQPKDTRTMEQKIALHSLISRLHRQFPGATIHGHCEFAKKACPCFDVHKDYSF